MARTLNRLTVAAIKAAKVGDVLRDGGGLEAKRTSSGITWILRFTSPVTRKRREAGLGAGLTLKAARERAEKMREIVRRGGDPLVAAQEAALEQQQAMVAREREATRAAATLAACASSYHRTIAGGFRNLKHRKQWLASLEGSLPAWLWNKPMSEITPGELIDVLTKLRERVPETARRVRQRLAAIFDDAVLHEVCDRNPAQMIARRMRSNRSGEPPHFRNLHHREVAHFLRTLRASERVGIVVRLAIEFAVLTASRSGEVRGATWGEIDRQQKQWVVPAARMKASEIHRVDLSPRALDILDEADALRANASPSALIFPAPRDASRPLSDMALTQALRRLETGGMRGDGTPEVYADLATLHGFRSSFKTWAKDNNVVPLDVIEAALAHREKDRVAGAYDRSREQGENFERDMRKVRLRWADFVCKPERLSGNVITFKRKAS